MSQKIIVQTLSRYPITPHTYLVNLNDADWPKFLSGDNAKRMEILKPYVRDIRHGLYATREIIWIAMEAIKETDKADIINALQPNFKDTATLNTKIALIDGSKLDCYPIALPSEETVSGEFSLDTTGKYLQVGKKPHFVTDKELAERRKQEEIDAKLFYEHIHLFLANADKILSDSRLFLSPVNVVNGLAYTGTSGFRRPTLGVYIEWWLYHKDASIDAKGNPIWFISGSPLSGRNACSTVDRKGKTHRAQLNGSFSAVWGSFAEVNNRYNEFKGRYMAYDLKEVIDILEGTTDAQQLFKLHLRLEKVRYDKHIANLKNALKQSKELSLEYKAKIQNLIFQQHCEEATEYYRKCVNLQTIARLAREYFYEQRIELRKKLRSGNLDNVTYQKTLTPLRKKAMEAENQCYEYEREGLNKVFGDDDLYFNFNAIERLLTDNNIDK